MLNNANIKASEYVDNIMYGMGAHDDANPTCQGAGIKCTCWDVATMTLSQVQDILNNAYAAGYNQCATEARAALG